MDLLACWRDDPNAAYRSWFLWNERLKNFRSIRPNSDARETLCPSIYAGTERQRTYEAHEEASFRAWNPSVSP